MVTAGQHGGTLETGGARVRKALWVARLRNEVVLASARLSPLSQGSLPGAPASTSIGLSAKPSARKGRSGAVPASGTLLGCHRQALQPRAASLAASSSSDSLSRGGCVFLSEQMGPGLSLPHGQPAEHWPPGAPASYGHSPSSLRPWNPCSTRRAAGRPHPPPRARQHLKCFLPAWQRKGHVGENAALPTGWGQ